VVQSNSEKVASSSILNAFDGCLLEFIFVPERFLFFSIVSPAGACEEIVSVINFDQTDTSWLEQVASRSSCQASKRLVQSFVERLRFSVSSDGADLEPLRHLLRTMLPFARAVPATFADTDIFEVLLQTLCRFKGDPKDIPVLRLFLELIEAVIPAAPVIPTFSWNIMQ